MTAVGRLPFWTGPAATNAGRRRSRMYRAVLVMAAVTGLAVVTAWFGGRAIAAVVAVIGAVVLWRRPEAAGAVFTAVLILNLPAIGVQFYGVPSIVAGAASLILLLPIAAAVLRGRSPVVVTPALPWLFAYLLALLVSTLASTRSEEAVPDVVVFVLEGLILYLLVTASIRDTADLRLVIWVAVLAGGLLGAISIHQESRHAYDDDYLGLAQVQRGAIRVDAGAGEPAERPRLAGPVGETNRYAQVMLILLPLGIHLAAVERRRLWRILALASTLAILGAVVLTFSRGAIVVLAVLVVLMSLSGLVRWRTVLVAGLALGLIASTTVPGFAERVESLRGVEGLLGTTDDASDPDGAIIGRATSNLAALGTFMDHPVVGVGPGIYFLEYSRVYANRLGLRYFDEDRRAHNLYLEIAADTGLVGLGSFLAVCGVTLLALRRARRVARERGDGPAASLCLAFSLALLAYLGTGVFLHLSYERYFWFLIAIANVAAIVAVRAAGAPAGASVRAPAVSRPGTLAGTSPAP